MHVCKMCGKKEIFEENRRYCPACNRKKNVRKRIIGIVISILVGAALFVVFLFDVIPFDGIIPILGSAAGVLYNIFRKDKDY